MKKILSALLAAMLIITPFGSASTVSADELATPSGISYNDIGISIDSYIFEREAGLASCAVSVFDRNGAIYNGYYGYADMENGIKTDEQTAYLRF